MQQVSIQTPGSRGECRFIRDYYLNYAATTAHPLRERRCSGTISHLNRRDLDDIPGRAGHRLGTHYLMLPNYMID